MSAPHIIALALPGDEKNQAWHLAGLLHELDGYIDKFRHAIAFCEYAEAAVKDLNAKVPGPQSMLAQPAERRKYLSWKEIAMRDAAMTLFHFTVIVQAIKEQLARCPVLMGVVRHDLLDMAIELSNKYFSGALAMRHAVAHLADLTKSPEAKKKHAFSGSAKHKDLSGIASYASKENGTIWLDQLFVVMVSGRTLTISRNKQVEKVNVTPAVLAQMQEVAQLIFDAFVPAQKLTREMHAE
jgi:hypothetical protein